GALLIYETGTGVARITRLLRADGSTQPIAELPGTGAVFSPDGRYLAYLYLAEPSDELRQAEKALAEATEREERQKRTAALNRLLAIERRIAIRDLATGTDTFLDTGTIGRTAVRLAAGGTVLFSGSQGDSPEQIYRVEAD